MDNEHLKVACDAMCGGVARWLRVFGIDTSFTPGIDDGDLVKHALNENRTVISSDGKLFERRVFTTDELPGLRLPVGLKLLDQVRQVVHGLHIHPGLPRCTHCNGTLSPITRADAADQVPARSLVWVREFFRCRSCGQIFWEGSHWRRIHAVRDRIFPATDSDK